MPDFEVEALLDKYTKGMKLSFPDLRDDDAAYQENNVIDHKERAETK